MKVASVFVGMRGGWNIGLQQPPNKYLSFTLFINIKSTLVIFLLRGIIRVDEGNRRPDYC